MKCYLKKITKLPATSIPINTTQSILAIINFFLKNLDFVSKFNFFNLKFNHQYLAVVSIPSTLAFSRWQWSEEKNRLLSLTLLNSLQRWLREYVWRRTITFLKLKNIQLIWAKINLHSIGFNVETSILVVSQQSPAILPCTQ